MKSAEEWRAWFELEGHDEVVRVLAAAEKGQQAPIESWEALLRRLVSAIQADALEAAARAVVEQDHSCSHTTCSGGEEVAAIIRSLLPPPQEKP